MNDIFSTVDRISTGTKAVIVAGAILIMWVYSLEIPSTAQRASKSPATPVSPVSSIVAPRDILTSAPSSSARSANGSRKDHSRNPPPGLTSEKIAHPPTRKFVPPDAWLEARKSDGPSTPGTNDADKEGMRSLSTQPPLPNAVPTPPYKGPELSPVSPVMSHAPQAPALSPSDAEALQRNYRQCLGGFGSCDTSSLTTQQIVELKTASLERNYRQCLSGFGLCDTSLLTARQAAEVKTASLERNHRQCLSGFGLCDTSLLTARQAAEVKTASLQRNYRQCLSGFGSCDTSLLTTQQAAEVNVASLQRNYRQCMSGFGSCDTSLLTTQQAAEVKTALRQRNYRQCLSGFGSCDTSLLTPVEAARVSAARSGH